mmetsp:Transcript_69177/g.196084  ORF Transcript_69177/g.196084 Transcript_69177/m.196084 type:complete len:226 (+) Transcript_69177:2-679(+)
MTPTFSSRRWLMGRGLGSLPDQCWARRRSRSSPSARHWLLAPGRSRSGPQPCWQRPSGMAWRRACASRPRSPCLTMPKTRSSRSSISAWSRARCPSWSTSLTRSSVPTARPGSRSLALRMSVAVSCKLLLGEPQVLWAWEALWPIWSQVHPAAHGHRRDCHMPLERACFSKGCMVAAPFSTTVGAIRPKMSAKLALGSAALEAVPNAATVPEGGEAYPDLLFTCP